MHSPISITFIIPTHGRPELLKKCLDSINSALSCLLPQDLRDFRFEARVVFNGEVGETLCSFESLKIHTLCIDSVAPSVARNIAIKSQISDYFYFIDDDTALPSDFLQKVCEIIRNQPDADIFGGPDTCANDVGLFEKSLDSALRSPLTTSRTRKRHTPGTTSLIERGHEKNLILCNLCVKASVFYKYGAYFPEDYFRNEENVFLSRLDGDLKVLHCPQLFIFHQRRPHLRNVFYAASRSGFFRFKMISENPKVDQFLFFIPSLFVIYVSFLFSFIPVFDFFSPMTYPFYLYIILNFITSLKAGIDSKDLRCLPFIAGYQLFIVSSYGIGMLAGITVSLKQFTLEKQNSFSR
jgi:GT2 family glycosyltransferase